MKTVIYVITRRKADVERKFCLQLLSWYINLPWVLYLIFLEVFPVKELEKQSQNFFNWNCLFSRFQPLSHLGHRYFNKRCCPLHGVEATRHADSGSDLLTTLIRIQSTQAQKPVRNECNEEAYCVR